MLYSDALMPNNIFYYDLQEPIPTYNTVVGQ